MSQPTPEDSYLTTYPRPSFQRRPLHWTSLCGPWSFLFDDTDTGLASNWPQTGLPASVDPPSSSPAAAGSTLSAASLRITEQITNIPAATLERDVFSRDAPSRQVRREIRVPFAWQTVESGVGESGVHKVFWYERLVRDPRSGEQKEKKERVLLRFGAVDYEARVWVNGRFVGGHRGGGTEFGVDVTEALDAALGGGEGEGEIVRITIRVFDSAHDLTQPRGKQYWAAKPLNIFYTPSGGIWQPVWLEVVPETRIADSSAGTLIQSHDIESGMLRASVVVEGRRVGMACSVELEASLEGVLVRKVSAKLPAERDDVDVALDMRLSEEQMGRLPEEFLKTNNRDDNVWRKTLAMWSPEHPILYDLTIRLHDSEGSLVDEIHTTTGMRSLTWNDGSSAFKLNGKPYFHALVLDQGYWPSTAMTPPTPSALKTDIELAKRMGFNGCRKHQKSEDPAFLYWADKLGFMVWGEIGNAYAFGGKSIERFDEEWREVVLRDRNRPSVVAWTPVNESWGYPELEERSEQRAHVRSLYWQTKTLDPTRPINDNCGWEHVQTDLSTFHDYADADPLRATCSTLSGILGPKAKGRNLFIVPIPGGDPGTEHRVGAPVLCTEFGGVNIAPAEKKGDGDKEDRDWGYTTASDSKDLLKRIERLMHAVVDGGHVCGFVYTQLTDIEQEVNGLYDFHRREKLDADAIREVVEEVKRVYYDSPER